MQRLRAIKKTHERLSEIESCSKDEHIVSEEDKYFNLIETDKEKVKLHFTLKFSPEIVRFINQLIDVFKIRPMRINVMQVCVIEFCFWMSQKREPIKSTTIENGEIRIISQQTSIEDFAQKRISLIKDDYDRKISLMNRNIVALWGDEKGLELYAQKLFSENISSTDPMFGLYFAFTLSQCSVYDIEEFLDYQKELYHKNFNSFLSITLLKYKELLTDEHLLLAQDWVAKKSYQPEVAKPIEVHQETADVILPKSAAPTVIKYAPMLGNLSEAEITRFFDFLHEQKSKNGQPFMPKDKVTELLTNGLSLPIDEPTQRFTINIAEHEYWIIYACFYELWVSHNFGKNRGKEAYAKFLKVYFTNFDKTLLATIQNSLQTELPTKMGFNIKSYLPNFIKNS
jgi:hypothetical protein